MDKPITFNEWLGTQGNMVLLHANCCRIAFEGGQQSMQAKVEEQAQEIADLKSLIQGHELRHQQNLSIKQKLTRRSEELQEEFAEDERFLKEQIKDKDLKISNLEYQQGMDKELIQSLQSKSEKLETKLKQAYEDVDTFATAHEALEQRVDRDRSLIQFTQRANKDLIAGRDELQKRVDAALAVLTEYYTGSYDESPDLVVDIEQALKGEG
ncbi:TPA: hypothetical protein ACNH0K_003805 [Acinetobacter baumannii]